ncbi:MAG: V-type ATP synthase subunit I [Clostridia bacterium]|nr:V-type ATP synthase subunit I [Clostridia bacterium]
MAKLKVMSIELAAPLSRKDEVVDYLQRKGAVELSVPEATERFSVTTAPDSYENNDKATALVNSALSVLNRRCPQKKPLTAMLEPRKELTLSEWIKRAEKLDDVLRECEALIRMDKQIADRNADIVRRQVMIDSLAPWQECDIPVSSGFTKHTARILGSFRSKKTREELLLTLANELPERDCVDLEIISASEVETCVAVFCLKEDYEEIENVLRAEGFVRAPECGERTPRERIEELTVQNETDAHANAEDEALLADKAAFFPDLEFALDYLSAEREKTAALEKIAHSGRVCLINGYIAQRDAKRVAEYCENHFDAAAEVREPEEDEDVPVLLSNGFFSAPLENITGMYSMPARGDIDPTGFMSFFYYLFFGMMLSDAGYGLIISGVCGGLLLFKKGLERKWKNTLKMYLFCGLSTVFWGAMYGSWFGDAPAVICREFLHKDFNPLPPIWTDAVKDTMNVLIMCFILGLAHLFWGVLMKGWTDIKNGRKLDAVFDTVPTFLTVIGIAPIFFGLFVQDSIPDDYSPLGTFFYNTFMSVHSALKGVSTYILIAGVALVILTAGRSAKNIGGKLGGGLYGVYNLFSGYLGDVLSYARLLALGMATGVIGQVMNMLGTMPKNPVIKAIAFILVFCAGHAANLAINIIGAYVHTNRLQYVEFFSKFYEGGGRAFVPFAADTKYYRFKEEL